MNRMSAIIEREMRKFFRSPTLMIMSLMMPLMQRIIMGNAFGGKIVGARVAVWEMLSRLKRERDLTILITTHYMDEADKLCDRIAIVDHGTLVALGTPIELKQSVPGANVVEVHFDRETTEWQQRLEHLDGVTSVQAESAGFYRVLTSSGSKTTMQLVELAASLGETLTSLSVQNTSLDDVFVHYTGRQLRDEQVKPPAFTMPPRPGAKP